MLSKIKYLLGPVKVLELKSVVNDTIISYNIYKNIFRYGYNISLSIADDIKLYKLNNKRAQYILIDKYRTLEEAKNAINYLCRGKLPPSNKHK